MPGDEGQGCAVPGGLQGSPGGPVTPRPCPWTFAVLRAVLPGGEPGLRLAATDTATGQTWRHVTVLPDSEESHGRLLGLAFDAGTAWATRGWQPSPPRWRR